MNRHLARFTLIPFVAASLICTGSPAIRGALNPQKARIVVKKAWPLEPVKIVGVRTKNKAKIELGQTFDEQDDWLEGLAFTVANEYDKTVTAMTISLIFRREAGDTRPPFAWNFYFNPSPRTVEYSYRDRNKEIKAGKTVELRLSPKNYESLKRGFEEAGYPDSIQRVELEIREVGFDDGSMIYSGTLYLQDPTYPNDPTKKIKAVRPGATEAHQGLNN